MCLFSNLYFIFACVSNIINGLFPFKYPMKLVTFVLGGILSSRCTWSGGMFPSILPTWYAPDHLFGCHTFHLSLCNRSEQLYCTSKGDFMYNALSLPASQVVFCYASLNSLNAFIWWFCPEFPIIHFLTLQLKSQNYFKILSLIFCVVYVKVMVWCLQV